MRAGLLAVGTMTATPMAMLPAVGLAMIISEGGSGGERDTNAGNHSLRGGTEARRIRHE